MHLEPLKNDDESLANGCAASNELSFSSEFRLWQFPLAILSWFSHQQRDRDPESLKTLRSLHDLGTSHRGYGSGHHVPW